MTFAWQVMVQWVSRCVLFNFLKYHFNGILKKNALSTQFYVRRRVVRVAKWRRQKGKTCTGQMPLACLRRTNGGQEWGDRRTEEGNAKPNLTLNSCIGRVLWHGHLCTTFFFLILRFFFLINRRNQWCAHHFWSWGNINFWFVTPPSE